MTMFVSTIIESNNNQETYMTRWLTALTVVLAALSINACTSVRSTTANADRPLSIARQGSFFVGGEAIKARNLSLLPRYAPKDGGTVSVNQMYVHYQIPVDDKTTPLVLIHGCCLTGKSWETTPDGRMGWDELFVRNGFPTYIIDQISRGRSATTTSAIVKVKAGEAPADSLPQVFSAARESAWELFRFGPEYPKTFSNMNFPLEAQEEFWKQLVPDWFNALPTPNPTVPALSELATKLNGAILISHSQSGIYPFQVAVTNRKNVAGIIAVEPGACPAPTSDMTPFAGLPILILWGDNTEKSSLWGPRPKQCADFVTAANRAGAKAESVMLKDVGMPGATHMMMLDKNSLQIGEWLANWIDKHAVR